MNAARKQGFQALIFGALALLILTQGNRLASRHSDTLGVGVVMILLAVWEISRGKDSLFFRAVKKSEEPVWFWFSIFLTVFVGLVCVTLSFA